MDANEFNPSLLPSIIADRYRIVRQVGRGGMAFVYEAVDEVTGRRVALKKLQPSRAKERDGQIPHLFASEFHTLTQLAHPRVVTAYDYQILPEGAFYTMELLDGGDLLEHKNIPWQALCALLCDVCSALSLLHSRRFVHRDVTPRNIRCTRDGKAKLIDFGAMVPFGTHKRAVGTPSFTAPEVVMGQPLDGRADLYSLGATAYYALTGRHAYGARDFNDLRNAWRSRPSLPSRHAPEIPPDLDQTIMSLISLQPARRPASAGAVIERLTAIAGLTLDEQLQVERSYLSTPSLTERDETLQQVRRFAIQAARGSGKSLFLTGPRGVGLSRMVDACALEGKLAGGTVLRIDASDAQDGDWGGVRAILEQVVTDAPKKALDLLGLYAEVIAHIWPRITEMTGISPREFEQPQAIRAAAQNCLLKLMERLSRNAFVVITADDIDLVDEPTRAFIALLTQEVHGQRLMVVTAASTEATDTEFAELQLLRRVPESIISLQRLSLAGTERLLISVFGEVPNVRLLANHLHDLSSGLPAAIMQLIEHLLNQKAIRFQDNGWLLPATIARNALPTIASDLLRARIAQVDAVSEELVRAIALSRKTTVTIEDCGILLGQPDLSEVLSHLDQLVINQILRVNDGHYALGQSAWARLLVSDIEPECERKLQARVAKMFVKIPDAAYSAAGHFLAAGDPASAIDFLLLDSVRVDKVLKEDPARLQEIVRLLPSDWRIIMERVVAEAERLARPRHQRLSLQLMISQCLAVTAQLNPDLVRDVVKQLVSDSGLSDYQTLDASIATDQRLWAALERAQKRYDETPEAERGLPPSEAIPALAQLYIQIIGMVGASANVAFLQELPSLEPFIPLSPAIAIVDLNVRSTICMWRGQVAQAYDGNREMLTRMAKPDGVGLQPANHRYMQLAVTYSVAISEIIHGISGAEARIRILESDALFRVNAQRLRILQTLQRGDVELAANHMREAELMKIRNATHQIFEDVDTWCEAIAYIEIGDVARLRQLIERLECLAASSRWWEVAPLMVQGHILRLRGEPIAAVEVFARALSKHKAGEIFFWAPVARGYLIALAECGRIVDGRVSGMTMLAEAYSAKLTVDVVQIHFAMAVLELTGGDTEEALAHLQRVEKIREVWPQSEIFGGACHELRARIAIVNGDQETFETAAKECAKAFLLSRNPILFARHERLIQDAERVHLRAPSLSTKPPSSAEDETINVTIDASTSTIVSQAILSACNSLEERIDAVLSLATDQNKGANAMLYLVRDGVLSLVTKSGNCPDSKRIEPLVAKYLTNEIEDSIGAEIDPDDLVTSTVDTYDWVGPTGTQFAPALLSHLKNGVLAVTGVLVFDIERQRRPSDELLSLLSEFLTASNDVES